jgi:hypothetical protein
MNSSAEPDLKQALRPVPEDINFLVGDEAFETHPAGRTDSRYLIGDV